MVLCAGLGTRLRPLTDVRAKPLVPVGDRPALGHILGPLRAAGVPRAVVNAHHLAAQVGDFVRAQGWDVVLSEEAELLGTGGGLERAAGLLGPGDVLVWNGDILAELDVVALAAEHRHAATLVVQPLPAGEGPVGLDADGHIVRLRTARFDEEVSGAQFLGIYVLGAELRGHLPRVGGVIEDVLVPALARGLVLGTFRYDGAWYDIGSMAAYLAANAAWLAARGLPSWVGAGARVHPGVVLEGAVVGEGAVVRGEGVVARSVIWPGATAEAPLSGAVVTG